MISSAIVSPSIRLLQHGNIATSLGHYAPDRPRPCPLCRDVKTISEIAYAVGFSSQSHLWANFRRTMGLTPWKLGQPEVRQRECPLTVLAYTRARLGNVRLPLRGNIQRAANQGLQGQLQTV